MLQTQIAVDAYPSEGGNPEMLYPRRNFDMYKRLIAISIACRETDSTLDRSFVLCLPRTHLEELHEHFADYKYYILRTCTTDKEMAHVLWIAPAIESVAA